MSEELAKGIGSPDVKGSVLTLVGTVQKLIEDYDHGNPIYPDISRLRECVTDFFEEHRDVGDPK